MYYEVSYVYLVFGMPKGLTPRQGCENALVVEKNSFCKCLILTVIHKSEKKNKEKEIEQLVSIMLEVGVIQLSSSLSSDPVLPVKKDVSWYFVRPD